VNGAGGEPGDDELQFQYMQRGWVTGWDSGFDQSPIGFFPNITIPVGIAPNLDLPEGYTPKREGLPRVGCEWVFVRGEGFVEVCDTIRFEEPAPTDWSRVVFDDPPPPIVYADVPVISPDTSPTGTTGETSSSDTVEEEEPVSIWGDIADTVGGWIGDVATGYIESGAIWQPTPSQPSYATPQPVPYPTSWSGADWLGTPATAQPTGGSAVPQMDPGNCPPPNARYLRYNCQTGALSKIPRKRRKKLFSASDLKDIAALKTLIGGGAALNGVVVAAIRR